LVPKDLDEHTQALAGSLEVVVRAAFGQRRKTLRNTLKTLIDPESMTRAGIDPGLRAEMLSVEAFLQLAEIHQSNKRQ
jgi:16S rRNA (adenine1518-N6/adenine1519-N6)-dimethyltransferase